MQLYLVDEWGEAGDAAGALASEGELVGEVEAVDAAGIHDLECFDETGEHGIADDGADGFALAVGLVVGLAVEHGVAAIVEIDVCGVVGVGTFAGLEDFVVEAGGVFLDVGVLFDEAGEVFFLLLVDNLLAVGGLLHCLTLRDHHDLLEDGVVGAVVDGLFLASECGADGFDEDFRVDVFERAGGEAFGGVAAEDPGEAVHAAVELVCFGFVAAGGEERTGGQHGGDDEFCAMILQ